MQEAKYQIIGEGYNLTRRADTYLTNRLLHLLQPETDKLYLDVGCGTGNYTIELANKGLEFFGVEPSENMLQQAQLRNQKVNWLKGTAEEIPTKDNTFSGAIATLTIHHWTDLGKSLTEINRVLCDNSRVVFLTSTPEQMKGYWLNHYFPKMIYASIIQMPSLASIHNAAINTGFEITNTEKYFIQDDLQDHFLYVGKNKPQLYFNNKIRSGISSFSSLANLEEVEQGLKNLKKDIETDKFNTIKKEYENELGDYMFIVAEKKGGA